MENGYSEEIIDITVSEDENDSPADNIEAEDDVFYPEEEEFYGDDDDDWEVDTVELLPEEYDIDQVEQSLAPYEWLKIRDYEGRERDFPFFGETIHVSRALDKFIYYRKVFRHNARIQSKKVQNDYYSYVYDLNTFNNYLPQIYVNHMRPLIDDAYRIILSNKLYDITYEEFAKQHTLDFRAADKSYQIIQEAIQNTLINNHNGIVNSYNSIPNIGFIGGIGTILAVEVANYAIQSSFENAVNNVRLYPAQEQEIYHRVNPEGLMFEVYADYWDVSYSLTWRLNTHDCDCWYPTSEGNQRAEGLYRNLEMGMIPYPDIIPVIIQILENNPRLPDIYGYMKRNYPNNKEVADIAGYFGFA